METRMISESLNAYSFELGPIRPPSEARSLLIRATRNCPWNRCQFCPVYKTQKFELRPVEEIEKDIQTARAISEEIRVLAWKMGYGGRLKDIAAMLCNSPHYNASVRSVALWLYFDAESAFLQDANSLIMRTPDLVRVIRVLKAAFPNLTRITSYGRSKTTAKKSLEELKELYEAGLSRLHVGLETGYDDLLRYMQKGVTAEEHVEGGRRVKESGISLCEYVMPGLGGKNMSKEHVEQTARVLNEIEPDYIRLRTLEVGEGMPLFQKLQEGDFKLQTEDEVVEEIGALVERLDCRSELKSDHILNLLSEVEGKLPQDKEKILAIINRYLALPLSERVNFQLGRRAGYYERLDELQDAYKHEKVEQVIKRIESENSGGVEEAIYALKTKFV
jgi:radical SAM superfamily enzyme YgiQ (UPF0313 family)